MSTTIVSMEAPRAAAATTAAATAGTPLWKLRSAIGIPEAATALDRPAILYCRHPEAFTAVFMSSRIRSIELGVFDATTHRATRTAKLIAADGRDVVSLVFTRTGSLNVYQDGRSFLAPRGTLFVLRSRAPYRYSAHGAVSIASVSIPSAKLPLVMLRSLRQMTASRLTPSVLNRSTLAYLEALLSTENTPNEAETQQIEDQLILLVSGLIVENYSSPALRNDSDSAYLRKALQLIAANSFTRGYCPNDVAQALGVDLRRLYRIFGAEIISVAGLIRDARLEQLARTLADPANRSPFSELATDVGFFGADQAARAFHRKYGLSMRAYRVSRRP